MMFADFSLSSSFPWLQHRSEDAAAAAAGAASAASGRRGLFCPFSLHSRFNRLFCSPLSTSSSARLRGTRIISSTFSKGRSYAAEEEEASLLATRESGAVAFADRYEVRQDEAFKYFSRGEPDRTSMQQIVIKAKFCSEYSAGNFSRSKSIRGL